MEPAGRVLPGAPALRLDADLVAVSKLLGHAQVTTTQVYLDHLAMEDLRGALPDLPLGDLAPPCPPPGRKGGQHMGHAKAA